MDAVWRTANLFHVFIARGHGRADFDGAPSLESDIDKWILIATLVGFFAAVSIPAAKATSRKPA
jgi:hypothetical protein